MIPCDAFVSALKTCSGVNLRPVSACALLTVLVGSLQLDGDGIVAPLTALCTVSVPRDIEVIIPRLACHEHWIHNGGANWHIFSDRSLCIELPERWQKQLLAISRVFSPKDAAKYAAEYFLNSARWLLTRHRYAFENGLAEWPQNWPQWAHGESGRREYFSQHKAA